MKIWENEEVKELFFEVEQCKKQQKALKNAFIVHAKKFNRKPNSVRNYYYHEIDNLSNDSARANILGVDLKEHQKTHFDAFEKESEEELFEKIEELVKGGKSVRCACLTLSGGDLNLMTRYQNKYQNMKRKIQRKDNIIPFRKSTHMLSDADINSLFMGLVRLIKRSALEEVNSKNPVLEKAFLDLSKKDRELSILKSEFENLKKQNMILVQRLEKTKKEALFSKMTKNLKTDLI